MDFGALADNLLLIAIIVGLVLLVSFLRRKSRAQKTRREIAQDLLAEVKLNQALAETFALRGKPKRFETVSWQRGKDNLDFLSQSLQGNLAEAFAMAEDFNRQLAAVKRYQSASNLVELNVAKLKELLDKSRQGLEQWFLLNIGTKEPPLQYPSFFDGLFGGR